MPLNDTSTVKTNKSDSNDDGSSQFGGMVRSLRSVITNLKLITKSNKALIKTADKVSDLLEFKNQVKTMKQGEISLKYRAAAILNGFLKSSVCYTSVFMMYDHVLKFNDFTTTFIPSVIIAGGLGGVTNGVLSYSWDLIAENVSNIYKNRNNNFNIIKRLPNVSIRGYLGFHTITTSSLFLSYEVCMLELSKYSPVTSDTTPIVNSMISGAVAGLVCEYVSTIIAPIQTTNKFNITFRLPQGVFLSVILPTSLGFMVYEYEKNYN